MFGVCAVHATGAVLLSAAGQRPQRRKPSNLPTAAAAAAGGPAPRQHPTRAT